MKFLVVAGTPSFDVPGLGIKVQADSSQFAIDGFQVAKALLEAGHEVTVIADDMSLLDNVGHDSLTKFEALDMDDLRARARYLSLEVEYDGIAVCLQLPRFSLEGMYTSHDRVGSFGASDLYEVELDEVHFPQDPFLRFEDLKDDVSPVAADVYRLREQGCKAGIMLLEAVSAPPDRRTPHEVIQDRCENLRDCGVEMVILDTNMTGGHKKGAYCVGRNGANFAEATRLETFIVEALELGKHEKPKTKEELKKLRAAAKGKATKARNKAVKALAEAEATKAEAV